MPNAITRTNLSDFLNRYKDDIASANRDALVEVWNPIQATILLRPADGAAAHRS